MKQFLLRRFLYGALVLLGVVILTFCLFNLLPGDPARLIAGQRSDPESLQAIRKELGVDQPATFRFLSYLNNLSPLSFHLIPEKGAASLFSVDQSLLDHSIVLLSGDSWLILLKWPYFGRSFQSRKPVSQIMGEAFPQTLLLAFVAMFFATIFGVFAGMWMAVRKDTFWDRLLLFISVLGMAGPSFFMAILIAWLFGFEWAHITGLEMTGTLISLDDLGNAEVYNWKSLVLPAFTLGIRPLALIAQLSRNSFLDVLSQDYIRTARAKGLSESRVLFVHALPNALNPVITASSGWFAGLLAGAVFIEFVFGWQGIGKVLVDALDGFDFPVVMGCVLIISVFFVIINLLVDLLYTRIDPRVRLSA